jgi:ABC-type branched-subunit amino acid transport system ATPase component
MSLGPDAVDAACLGKRYGSQWALQDCSVSVPRGRISALVGPNGAGKTTLLKSWRASAARQRVTRWSCCVCASPLAMTLSTPRSRTVTPTSARAACTRCSSARCACLRR